MAVIYRPSDRLRVKINDIEVSLSPLSFAQKSEIQELALSKSIRDLNLGAFKAIKYAVKDIKGLELGSGEKYQLEFNEGVLTDECVEDLLNFAYGQKLADVSSYLLNGVPSDFINPLDGTPLEGVKIIKQGSPRKKSKASS